MHEFNRQTVKRKEIKRNVYNILLILAPYQSEFQSMKLENLQNRKAVHVICHFP